MKVRIGKFRVFESFFFFIFYRDGKRKGVFFSRTVFRVEFFEDRFRFSFLFLFVIKLRFISFFNVDILDYENILVMNSDYENI